MQAVGVVARVSATDRQSSVVVEIPALVVISSHRPDAFVDQLQRLAVALQLRMRLYST